jgi:hypothetical protein
MKTSLAVITLLAILSVTAHAGVGETVKRVEARYGKPEDVVREIGSFRALGYRYRGLMVIVGYVAGVCKTERSAASWAKYGTGDDLEAPLRLQGRSNLDPQRRQSRCAS